jgi:hypothetical protein
MGRAAPQGWSLAAICIAIKPRACGSDCVSCRNCGGFPVVSRDPGGWLPMALPARFRVGLASERVAAAGVLPWRGSKRDRPILT